MPHYRRLIGIVSLLILVAFTLVLTNTQTASAQDSQQTHTVQTGENLFRIALKYGVTVEALAAANNITDTTKIFVGQVLVIPSTSGSVNPPANVQPTIQPQTQEQNSQAVPPAPPVDPTTGKYTVQPGDTLNIIARKFGISWVDLVNANRMADPNHIEPGQSLIIPGAGQLADSQAADNQVNNPPPPTPIPPTAQPAVQPTALAPANTTSTTNGQTTYVVQQGEGLAAIGRKFNVPWPDIAGANNITDPNLVYAGMTLTIPTPSSTTTMETSQGVPPGPDQAVNGKFIRVVLHEQRVYAYDNGQLVHTTLGSTGLPGTPTVQGNFKIYVKYQAQLMTGPGYYLPGVPWVMYFYEGYSLHGTYWHSNWGHPMSHGCVNLPTDEAKWYYDWAEVGTPVSVIW